MENKLEYLFHRKLCKMNLNRMYGSSIVFFAAFLILGSIGFFTQGEVSSAEVSIAVPVVLMGFCAAGVFAAGRMIAFKYEKYQQACYLIFWGVMAAGIFVWVQLHSNPLWVMTLYGIFLFMFSAVPLFPAGWYTGYFVIQACAALGLVMSHQGMGAECILCVLGLNGFAGCLICSRYQRFREEVENEYRVKEAIILSETDPMTELLNRRGLERSLESVWPYCVRQSVPTAVIMLDIDNFKKYNDTFGHEKGDECIRRVAEMVRDAAKRKTDLAARIGGEEFLILLSGLDHTQAILWAKNLKNSIDKMAIPHEGRSTLPIVTVSMGISWMVPPSGREVTLKDSYEYMKLEADQQLYLAKKSGRACICYNGQMYGKRGLSEYIRLLRIKSGEVKKKIG